MKFKFKGYMKPSTHFQPLFILAALTALALGSCGKKSDEWHSARGAVWNTAYNMTYNGTVSLDDTIQHTFNAVDRSLSPFNRSSAISLINRNESCLTDSMIRRMVEVSKDVCRASDGRFDPTVSPLVNLWGFGYEKKSADEAGISVDRTSIDSALTLVGILDCRMSNDTLFKKREGTTFNFSAVTKGYACDLIGDALSRNGADNFMVEIGGEIALKGRNPKGELWRIQIDAPIESRGAEHEKMAIIELTDCGIATSGNYRNFKDTERHGRIAHTIDPTTGFPAKTEILSATVIADNCALADALATACMAMPEAIDALELVKRFEGTKAVIVYQRDGETKTLSHPENLLAAGRN